MFFSDDNLATVPIIFLSAGKDILKSPGAGPGENFSVSIGTGKILQFSTPEI